MGLINFFDFSNLESYEPDDLDEPPIDWASKFEAVFLASNLFYFLVILINYWLTLDFVLCKR